MSTRRAFTLMEMVLSLGVVAVIGAAMVSTLTLASRSVPRANDLPTTAASARAAAEALAGELSLARSVTVAGSRTVEFTSPDVTGDGVDDTIRWAWSGNAGDPLARTVNGATTSVLAAAHDLAIAWSSREQTVTQPGPNAAGTAQTLAAFDDSYNAARSIGALTTLTQRVRPLLPPDAVSFKVTSVSVRLRKTGVAPVNVTVSLRSSRTGLDLASGIIIANGAKDSVQMYSAAMTTTPTWSPGESLWIVLTATVSVDVVTQAGVANAWTDMYVGTVASPTFYSDESSCFVVTGTVTRPSEVSAVQTRLTAADIRLAVTDDPDAVMHAAARLVAEPVVPPAVIGADPVPDIIPDLGKDLIKDVGNLLGGAL